MLLNCGLTVYEEDIEKAMPMVLDALRHNLPKEMHVYPVMSYILEEIKERMASEFILKDI